jgi:hypothetical protein
MRIEDVAIVLPELDHERGASLDVGEEEGDGPCRKLALAHR